jgi:hypothetical protein
MIAEQIRAAMDAVDEMEEAEELLRLRANHENFTAFRESMETLSGHLHHLKQMLDHEDEMALDELGDALSRAFHGHVAEYRHAEGHG